MTRNRPSLAFVVLLWCCAGSAWAAQPALVRAAHGKLQVGLDAADGSLREMTDLSDGYNQLDDAPSPLALWQITLRDGETARDLAALEAGPPKVEHLTGDAPGLRLVWDCVAPGVPEPVRVEVLVRLGPQDAAVSRWQLSVAKPKHVRLERVRFPRVSSLRRRAAEALAVPVQMGTLTRDPRALAQGKDNRGARLAWRSPHGTDLSLPCLAFYQENGPGFYAACDDAEGFRKDLALWGDGKGRMHFEIVHEPEQEAAGIGEYRLPFAAVLGAFRGDWTTAAAIYRESPAARTIAARGRLRRQLTPAWLGQTGLWVWNRGRSPQVLQPAVALRKHIDAPVSVLWHWWHGCPYDAGFPEYLPPREGAESFQAALAAARQEDVRAILYMNQRLWGTTTTSWTDEGAEAHAVKGKDGKVALETYNVFMKTPCAPMCIATRFWRDKYAALAEEVLCRLRADGVYMDQVGVWANCYDPRHGHIAGPGRYWTDGLAMLASEIRDRSSAVGPVALAGEFCGEPWIGSVDVMLALSVSADRLGSRPPWEPIPFFQAVYHPCTIVFGNMAGLVHPPYDEKWPPEQAPAVALTLLDRKFAKQFYLEHARTFAWGMQPMLANFLPSLLKDRPEEMDYVTRLVRTRQRALKYLLHGTWLRPPPLDVPQQEIDVAQMGVYTPLRASKRTCPVALAGAWRAPDGDVAVALASISDEPLPLKLAMDAQGYGLPEACGVYRLDHSGRAYVGRWTRRDPAWPHQLPARGLCVLEFSSAGAGGAEDAN